MKIVNRKTGEIVEGSEDEMEEVLTELEKSGEIGDWDFEENTLPQKQYADMSFDERVDALSQRKGISKDAAKVGLAIAPNLSENTINGGDSYIRSGLNDLATMLPRTLAGAGSVLNLELSRYNEYMNKTSSDYRKEGKNFKAGLVSPEAGLGLVAAPAIGPVLAAESTLPGIIAGNAVTGLGLNLAGQAIENGQIDPSEAGVSAIVGGIGGAVASGLSRLISMYGKEQVRRVAEFMRFGNAKTDRKLTDKDLVEIFSDPEKKARLEKALQSIGFRNKEKSLNLARNDAADKFLADFSTPSTDIKPNVEPLSDLSRGDIEKASLNIMEDPYDGYSRAVLEMSANDPSRSVKWKPLKFEKNSVSDTQNYGNADIFTTGKNRKAQEVNLLPKDAAFLEKLHAGFSALAKNAPNERNNLNLKGERYITNPKAMSKVFYEDYFKPLQDAAISPVGITEDAFAIVLSRAAKNNDVRAMNAILKAADVLGFSKEQIEVGLNLSKDVGQIGKLQQAISTGADVNKYGGDLPLNLSVINAKGLNPLAGVSGFAGKAYKSMGKTYDLDNALNIVSRKSRPGVIGGRLAIQGGISQANNK